MFLLVRLWLSSMRVDTNLASSQTSQFHLIFDVWESHTPSKVGEMLLLWMTVFLLPRLLQNNRGSDLRGTNLLRIATSNDRTAPKRLA